MPTKKRINEFINCCKEHDTIAAINILEDVSLVNAIASAPPSKHDGLSMLHIAFKYGAADIAIALIQSRR